MGAASCRERAKFLVYRGDKPIDIHLVSGAASRSQPEGFLRAEKRLEFGFIKTGTAT